MGNLERDVVIGAAIYLVFLLGLGYLGRRARREDTISDHFLAGRGIGFFVLLLTLFATQYSGNSLSGFPGRTYREGLPYVMCVTFMVGIVAGYLLFAPQLFSIARRFRFVTPTDFLRQRYDSRWLQRISVAIFVFVLTNFLLAQLKAMGNAFSGLTGQEHHYVWAIVIGAAVILIYELLGGMRAVAWTDALQGVLLMAGLLILAILLSTEIGTPAEVIRKIAAQSPQKAAAPDGRTCMTWISYFLLLGLGAPLYPQAIQRIYAARTSRELRRALGIMSFLPLVAITTVVYIGLAGIALDPDHSRAESDRITFIVLSTLVEMQPAAYLPTLVVMLGVLAAIMSTADSCLLSLTSILSHDVFGSRRVPGGDASTRGVAWISFAVMGILAAIALDRSVTLWQLLTVKFEVLIQLSPAFVLGCWHHRDDPRGVKTVDVVRGLFVGLLVGVGLFLTKKAWGQGGTYYGMHAGTLGVIVNYTVVVISWRLRVGSMREAKGAEA